VVWRWKRHHWVSPAYLPKRRPQRIVTPSDIWPVEIFETTHDLEHVQSESGETRKRDVLIGDQRGVCPWSRAGHAEVWIASCAVGPIAVRDPTMTRELGPLSCASAVAGSTPQRPGSAAEVLSAQCRNGAFRVAIAMTTGLLEVPITPCLVPQEYGAFPLLHCCSLEFVGQSNDTTKEPPVHHLPQKLLVRLD
jgi:hypothetical protein